VAPLAINVAVAPEQILAFATDTVGCGDMVTVVVFELEHEALVALIV
jgi:hypothetical protein